MKSSKQNSKFKLRFTIPAAVLSLAVVGQLSGCSQQRHVTEPSPEQPATVTQPVAAQPAPAVVAETPEPAPAVVTPAPASIVAAPINGLNGAQGPQGDPGLNACNPRKLATAPVELIAYNPSEILRIKNAHGVNPTNTGENLPYLTQRPSVRARLDVNTTGQLGNASVARGQQRFNRDTYVLFKMRIAELIERRFIVPSLPITASLNLNVSKRVASGDPFVDTEAVCVLDVQKCSGMPFPPFATQGWNRLANSQFNNGNLFVNNSYVGQQIRAAFGVQESTRLASSADYRTWFRSWSRRPQNPSPFMLALDLAKLLHPNPESGSLSATELLDLLYGNAAPEALVSNRTLHFAVLDDLLVHAERTTMTIRYYYDECEHNAVHNPTATTPRPAAPAPAVVTPVETTPSAAPTEVPATPATPAAPAVEEAAPAAAPETTPAVQTPAAPGTPAAESNTNDSEDTE